MSGYDYGRAAAIRAAQRRDAREAESAQRARAKARRGRVELPPLYALRDRAYRHTQDNIRWEDDGIVAVAGGLCDRYDGGARAQILVLPTGVGKTSMAVRTLAEAQVRSGGPVRFIVSAPRAVVDGGGWQETIASYNLAHPENALDCALVTTHDKLSRILNDTGARGRLMRELGRDVTLVIDEVHAYKNMTSKRAKSLQKVPNWRILGLTATPLTNDVVNDAGSYLVMAGYFRNKTDFYRSTGLDGLVDGFWRPAVYRDDGTVNTDVWPWYDREMERLSHVIYAPSIRVPDGEMPDVFDEVIQLPRSESLDADMESLARAYRDRMFGSAGELMLAECERVCRDADRLDAMAGAVGRDGVTQPLVFFWHTDTADALAGRLAADGYACQVLDGSHPLSDIDMADPSPILVQYQAGGAGVEFKNSNMCILYENQYSYTLRKQALGRNVRRGGTGLRTRVFLISDTPFDRSVFERVANRETLNAEQLEELALSSVGETRRADDAAR